MLADGAWTPLQLGDFTFYGFDDLIQPLEDSLHRVGIRHGEPMARLVEDAVFVPASARDEGGYEGALLTHDGQAIASAQERRGAGAFGDRIIGRLRQPVTIAPEQVVDEEVVYLGWCYKHFGHLLLNSLARIWVLEQLDPSIKVVFHIEKRSNLTGMTVQMLEAFGVPIDRILLLDADTQTLLRRVIVPEPLYEVSSAAHERMGVPFRQVAAPLVHDAGVSDQPVYLSRRLLPSTNRPIAGEFDLEEVLRENGFLVVHPETMTLVEQIRLVNRHRDIFTSAGSAAYLSLFAVQPSRIHLLTSGVPFQDYFLVPKVASVGASFSNCFAGDNRPSHFYLPPMVVMDRVADYLQSLGLLRRRLRADLLTRHRDFRSDYEEARLYTELQHRSRGERLSPEIEGEALILASSSWALAWGLACYYARHDPARIEQLVQQFIALVSTEADGNRLISVRPHIESYMRRIVRTCRPPTAARLANVLADRFNLDLDQPRERADRRRSRAASGRNQADRRPERADRRHARQAARLEENVDRPEAV